MTPSQAVRRALIDAGVGVDAAAFPSTAWPIFVASLPDGDGVQDKAIAIYDTTGVRNGRLMGTGRVITHPGIQVRIRSNDYLEGHVKAVAVAAALDAIKNTTVTVSSVSKVLQNVSRRGDILPLGPEPQNRRRESFTVNAIVTLV